MKARFKEINTAAELESLFEKSSDQRVVLLKHSLTCPISSGVYQEVAKADADVNLIIMQKARNISNLLAEKTGIRHESPQAIILHDGKSVYHASHYDITADDIEKNAADD